MPDTKLSYSNFKEHPAKTSSKMSTRDRTGHPDSSTNITGRRLSAAGALLKDKHPELFYVAPRPGGFVKNITSPHKDPSKTRVAEKENKSHSQKPTMLGTETNPASINDVLETQIACPTFHKFSKEEERNNMVRMCSIALSTVIMLAQHTYEDITLEHVKHTEAYFRALKQGNGYPQNIGQLMQVLANLKRSGKIVTPPPDEESSEDEAEDSEDVEISDIINN